MLTPQGVMVLIDQAEQMVPWQATLNALLAQFSTNQEYRSYDLMTELTQRGHFTPQGAARTSLVPFRQSLDAYIESFHSRNGFSRQRMTPERAAAFDAALTTAVLPFCAQHDITGVMQWGRPH